MSNERAFDVVVWGATGFTGQLVVRYLAEHYGTAEKPLRWAIAGRNEAKLRDVRDGLAASGLDVTHIQILTGDSQDDASLGNIAKQTRVILTTVGPYLQYGGPLVKACVEHETHYCDLTGEVPFIHGMMQDHHQSARAKQIKLVNSCGFDSIPSDLGCAVLQEHAQEKYGRPAQKITLYVKKVRGGASGGTYASMLGMLELAADRKIRRIMVDPYALYPEGTERGKDGRDLSAVKWDEQIQQWVGPFVMAAINTRVVRRSNALMGFQYGKDFQYQEVSALRSGLKARFRGEQYRLGLAAFVTLGSIEFTRNLMKKTFLLKPGEGPSPEQQKAGSFKMELIGTGTDEHGQPFEVRTEVTGDRDPGYSGTARMIAESAVALAHDTETTPEVYGVVTPASALGKTLVERLRQVGMSFEITQP